MCRNVKYHITVDADFGRAITAGVSETSGRFASSAFTTSRFRSAASLDEQLREAFDNLNEQISKFQSLGSGWVLSHIKDIRVSAGDFNPITAGQYIVTPKHIADSKAILNIKNHDENCFALCVVAHLHPLDRRNNPERPEKYAEYLDEIKMTGIELPVKIHDIPRFEKLNPTIMINVLYWEEDRKEIVPMYCTEHDGREHMINLFLLTEEKPDGTRNSHYTLVRNLSRLLSRYSKHREACYPCPRCLHRFDLLETLNKHREDCKRHKPCAIKMPTSEKRKGTSEPGNILRFTQTQNCFPVPFAIYLDFECYIDENNNDQHVPSGFCALRVSRYEAYNKEKVFMYSGEGVMTAFFEHMRKESEEISAIIESANEPMLPLTDEERQQHDAAVTCFTCNGQFTVKNPKCHHHCHVTGRYLSPTCQSCNLQLKFKPAKRDSWKVKNQQFIPVICHNTKSYDGHLILKYLKNEFIKSGVTAIASTMEKFISFQIDSLRFIDSCQYLPASLDSLAANLKKDGVEKFEHTKRHFSKEVEFELVCQKGCFPYEHFTSLDKFKASQLPEKSAFYSKLTDEGITDEEYQRANVVWTTFGCRNFKDYHDLYLKTDVLLLADVFENFRKFSLCNYSIDPLFYYSAPGLSWSACLRLTDVKMELLTDVDMLLFFERGIRGGVSSIMNRYARANNPYMGAEAYDPSKPTSYIHFLDANNLYGWAMSQKMPLSDFRWLSEEDIRKFDVMSCDPEGDKGYVLEVDLAYPESLHDEHNDYCLAPEHMSITEEMLSPYQHELKAKFDVKSVPTTKLVPNLFDKTKYVVHIKNLQLYVTYGLKITRIHRVIEFRQEAWLKPYIDFNTEKRKVATSIEAKNSFKYMNNSVFGRSCMNIRNHKDVKIVTNEKQVNRCISKPNYGHFEIINEDLVAILMNKTHIYWDKPTYLGFTILELSKTLMYEFHYDKIVPKYGKKAKLLMTDTDSLVYHIETDDIYKDMKNNIDAYDTSDYSPDHMCYSKENCKVLGKMKDECNGKPPVEFVGLRSKMYSILLSTDGKSKRTAKGIKKNYVKKHIDHEQYRKCLLKEESTTATFHILKSEGHTIRTAKVDKSALCPYDDKRFLLKDTTDTYAHGHYLTKM